jgi:hypothetical protein
MLLLLALGGELSMKYFYCLRCKSFSVTNCQDVNCANCKKEQTSFRGQAIDWLSDLTFVDLEGEELQEELQNATDQTLQRMVERLYDGGVYQFLMDCDPA